MLTYWVDKILNKSSKNDQIDFVCNVCGCYASTFVQNIGRETISCFCGSTVRLRSIIYILSVKLFDQGLSLPNFPRRPDIIGLELSGSHIYAQKLSEALGYTNTFFHKSPYLDIANVAENCLGSCDFIISSDVFEHIAPPVSRAFLNTFKLLKPGGLLLLTVPYTNNSETVEHFPDLYQYEIKEVNNQKILINTSVNGEVTQFNNVVFHGGDGETLEMRVFSESGVIHELKAAGFVDIEIHDKPVDQFGIRWQHAKSLPITARKGMND